RTARCARLARAPQPSLRHRLAPALDVPWSDRPRGRTGRVWILAARLLVEPPWLGLRTDGAHREPDVSALARQPAAPLLAGAGGDLGDRASRPAARRRAGVSRGFFGGQKCDPEHLRALLRAACARRLPRRRCVDLG